MAANQIFLCSPGEPQESQGSQLPPCGPGEPQESQGSQLPPCGPGEPQESQGSQLPPCSPGEPQESQGSQLPPCGPGEPQESQGSQLPPCGPGEPQESQGSQLPPCGPGEPQESQGSQLPPCSPGEPQESQGSQLPPCAESPGTLPDRQGWDSEMWHVVFRAFTSSEDSDPVQDLRKLSELCRLWLRPDLHTTEQILDKLVLEQFLISMPLELQVLVKDHNVQSCKDLEGILRRKEKPKTCTVVSMEGQKFLLQNSHEVEVGDEHPVMDLPVNSQSFVCEVEVHAENSWEVSQEPEDWPEIQDMSREQGQTALLPETIPKEGDLEGVRPPQTSEKDPVEDHEAMTLLIPPEPQLPTGPGVSVGMEMEEDPLEGPSTFLRENLGARANSTQDLETDVLPQRRKREDPPGARGPLRRKRPNTSTPQDVRKEGAVGSDEGQFSRQLRSHSVHTPSQRQKRSHQATVRKEARRPKSCECSDCKKTFQYKSQLDIHRRIHTGERPFKCNVCHRKFIQLSDLRVHLRIHTGERPHRCKICGKSFAHESTLRGHQKVHTKEKPYSCHVCQKPFSHKGNLNVHLRTHTGLRPYLCAECDHTFRQLSTLKRHQKTHANRTSQGSQLSSA